LISYTPEFELSRRVSHDGFVEPEWDTFWHVLVLFSLRLLK